MKKRGKAKSICSVKNSMMEGKTPAFLVLSSQTGSCPKQQINLTTAKLESSFGEVFAESSIDIKALVAYARKINKRSVESETNSTNNTQLTTPNIKLSSLSSQKTNKNDESNFHPAVKPMAHSLNISIPLEKINFSRKRLKETGILKEAFNTKTVTEKILIGAKNNSVTVSSKKDNVFKSNAEQKRSRQKKRPSRHSTVAKSANLRSGKKVTNQQSGVLHVLSEDLMLSSTSSTSDSDACLNNNTGGKVVPENSLFLNESDICRVNSLVIASKLPAHHIKNLVTFSEKSKPMQGKNGFNVNSETYHCDIYETPFHLTNSNGDKHAGSELSEDSNKTSPLQSNSLSSSPTIDVDMSRSKNDSDLESGLSDLNLPVDFNLANSSRKETDDKASDSTVELNNPRVSNQVSREEKYKLTTEAAELKEHYESYDKTFREEIVSESDDSSIEPDVYENLEISEECKVAPSIICYGTEMLVDYVGNTNLELTPCSAASQEKKVESSFIEIEQLDYEPLDSSNENSPFKDDKDLNISNSNLIDLNVECGNSLTKSQILEKPSTQPPLYENPNSHIKWSKDTIMKDLGIAENQNNNLPLGKQSKDVQLSETISKEPMEYSSDEIELEVHPDSQDLFDEELINEQVSSISCDKPTKRVPSLKDTRSEVKNLLESVKTLISQESFTNALNEIEKAEEVHSKDFEPSLEFLINDAFKAKRLGILKAAFDVFRRSFSKIKSLDFKRRICQIFISHTKFTNNGVPMIKSLFDLIRKNEPKVILVKDSFDTILQAMLKESKPDWRFIIDALEFSMEHCKNDPHINPINAVLKAAKQYPCNIHKRVSHLIINVMKMEQIVHLNEQNLRSFYQILKKFRSHEAEIIGSIIDKVWPATSSSFLNQSQSSHPISRSLSTNVPVASVPLNNAYQYYDFQNQTLEEIRILINLEKFIALAQYFNSEAIGKNDFEVLQNILISFRMCQDSAGRMFNKFLQVIDWRHRSSNLYLKQVTFLGQMGVSLFLALHRECRYASAMEVIQAMHKFDINYYSLQNPCFSKPLQNGLFQMSILATANKVALYAVDTCVKVQNPDFAIKILETFNWVRISPDSIAVIAEEEGKLRGTVLLTLARLLINMLCLSDENNYFVKIDLLCRGVRVICEAFKHIVHHSETIGSDDMEDIYNKYVILLLNSGLLDECLDLVNFFSKPRPFVVDLLPEAKRALLVMSKIKGRETRLMFTKLTLEGIYKLPVNNKVVFKSYFTVEEMHLQLEIFLDRLRFVIPKDPTKTFDQKYFLQIVIEHINKHPCGIHVLEPEMPFYSLELCLKRLSVVLSCAMNPPLEVVTVRGEISSTHTVTDLTPCSVYRYLYKNFHYCDNLIPQYWNVQAGPFTSSSISQPSTSVLQRNVSRNPKPHLLGKPTTQPSQQIQNSHTTSTERLRSLQNNCCEKSQESSLPVEIETSNLLTDQPMSNESDKALTESPPKKVSKEVLQRKPVKNILKRKMLLSSKILSSRSRLNASIGQKTVINDNIGIKNNLNSIMKNIPKKTKPLLRGTNVENGNTKMENLSGKTKSFLRGTDVEKEKSSLTANMTNFQVTPLTIPKSPNFSPPVLPNGPLLQSEERPYANNKVLPGIRRLSSESGQSSVDLQIVFAPNTNFKTVSPLLAKSPDFAPPGYVTGKLEKPTLQNGVDSSIHPCQVSDNILKKIKAFLIVQLQKKHKEKKNLTDGELGKLSSVLAQKFINAVSCKLGLSVLVLNAKVMKELNNFTV